MGALSFMGYIQGEGRQQSSLFPPTLEELVPEDHLVLAIEAYVARLDLQALGCSQPGKADQLRNPVNPVRRINSVGWISEA